MAKKEQKVYMPLVVGDWLKGTRGMKAEVRGVYISLLLYQWDNGFIPSDWEELCLIDPELPKVWDKLKLKFVDGGPGKLINLKNQEVKEFWAKQSSNGSKGGRPKKENPKENPNSNPDNNPNKNLHNAIDIDSDFKYKLKKEPVENSHTVTVEVPRETPETLLDCEQWTNDVIDGNDVMFINMVRSVSLNGRLEELARSHLALCSRYAWHETIKTQQAFRNSLLDHVRKELKKNGPERITKPGITGNKNTDHIAGLAEDHARRYGADGPRGKG